MPVENESWCKRRKNVMPKISVSRRNELKPHYDRIVSHLKAGGAIEVFRSSFEDWHQSDVEYLLEKEFRGGAQKIIVECKAAPKPDHCGFVPLFMIITPVDENGEETAEPRKCDVDGPRSMAAWLIESFGFGCIC
jgi:hypothetical protein